MENSKKHARVYGALSCLFVLASLACAQTKNKMAALAPTPLAALTLTQYARHEINRRRTKKCLAELEEKTRRNLQQKIY